MVWIIYGEYLKIVHLEKFSYHEISWLVEWFLKVLIISSYFLNFYVLLIHSELHIRISTYFWTEMKKISVIKMYNK